MPAGDREQVPVPPYLQVAEILRSQMGSGQLGLRRRRQAAGRGRPVCRLPGEHLTSWWSRTGVAAVLTEFASLAGG